MAQEIDDAAVLTYLKAKRAALDAHIAGLEAILGTGQAPLGNGAVLGIEPPAGAAGQSDRLGPGAFHGMSIPEAARKYLEITKKKQKTRAICDALLEGGIETGSKNFYNNVYASLRRTKDFIMLRNYWALASWHPTRAVVPAKPAKKTRRTRKGGKAQAMSPAAGKHKVVDIKAGTDKADTA